MNLRFKMWTLALVVAIFNVANSVALPGIPRHNRRQPFTIDELLTRTFPKKTSNDSSSKSPENLLLELPIEDVPTKYAKQIQTAGLQIEEEGLPDYVLNRIQGPEYNTDYESPYSISMYEEPISVTQINDDEYFNEVNGLRYEHHQVQMLPDRWNKRKKRPYSRNRKHRRVERAATALKERLWDDGIVPYEIDETHASYRRALIKQAMRHWENYTCIKFVERGPEHTNYIFFTEKPCGCCSFVGKKGIGVQALSLGEKCAKFGIVVHEIGHALGYYHEHTRPDRDNYVQIFKENIVKGQETNFDKLTTEQVNSLGQKYDYDSVMHYARNTYSKTGYLDTILPRNAGSRNTEIGQRVQLSIGDIIQTNLLYNCPKCGRTFQMAGANFSSPQPTNNSQSEIYCEWRISVTHGEKIVLNITESDIPKSSNCETHYIEIRDGIWNRSKLLKLICEPGEFRNIVSTGHRMLVTYRSKNPNSSKGFKASYEAVCGGDINLTSEGHLESPNFPEAYQPNKNCVWRISVEKGYNVALRFLSFDLESYDQCSYDYVEVRDGLSSDAKLIGTYCGETPDPIVSTSNELLVRFVTDSSVQRYGFSAKIYKEYDECEQTNHGCEQQCVNTFGSYACACEIGYELHSDGKKCVDACGGLYTEQNGTVTSPSFPETYPKNKNCIYQIEAPKQQVIFLNFTHLDIEGNNFTDQICEYDKIEVFSNYGKKLKKHKSICGSKVPTMIVSETNIMRIWFSSDNSVEKTGFAAVYFMDVNECLVENGGCEHYCVNTLGSYHCTCRSGFNLHKNKHSCEEGDCVYKITYPYGSISSPNYPGNYPARKDCVWNFSTLPGHRIRLSFFTFELEGHSECHNDYVDVYDGPNSYSSLLGRYCGNEIPNPVFSTDDDMYMVFKSDSSVSEQGFKAAHSSVCGGLFKATVEKKKIYSHPRYFNSTYDAYIKCNWIISVDDGYYVQLSFLEFDLEEEINCQFDYVEIFDGGDSDEYSLGRFCGKKKPLDITSSQEDMLIQFRANGEVEGKGFVLTYEAVEQPGFDDQDIMEGMATLIMNNLQQIG